MIGQDKKRLKELSAICNDEGAYFDWENFSEAVFLAEKYFSEFERVNERKAVDVDVYENEVVEIEYSDGKKQACRCTYHNAMLINLDKEDFEIR